MGIETFTFERFTCDRCNTVEDTMDSTDRGKWGKVQAQGMQGASILLKTGYSMTLCPKCCASLQAWSNQEMPVG